jgi:hypothetical protein
MDKYKIYLDGTLVPSNEWSGLDGMTINITTSNYEQSIDMANEITFYGTAMKFIKSKLLVDTATANMNSVLVDIEAFVLGSYRHVYSGVISDEYSFCLQSCSIKCKMLDRSLASQKMDCVNSVLITDTEYNGRTSRGEDEGAGSVILGYYDESRPRLWTMALIVIMMMAVYTASIFLRIAQLLTLGLVDLSGASNFITGLFMKPRYHKAVFFLTFFQNVCKLCDLKLNAPLFTGDKMRNLARLDASLEEGSEDRNMQAVTNVYRAANSPNITFSELMQSLSDFNLHYRVSGDTLHVGTYTEIFNTVWIDFSQRVNYSNPCYDAAKEKLPAIGVYKYSTDALDALGNEAILQGVYKQNITYATGGNNLVLKGSNQKTFQYAPTRVVGDGLPSIIEWIGNSAFLSLLPNNGRNKRAINGRLLMQRGVTGLPKIVAIDMSSPVDDARIEKGSTNQLVNTGISGYMPATYNERAFLGLPMRNRAQEEGLFSESRFGLNFHIGALLFEDNPNYSPTGRTRYTFTITFPLTCEDLDAINSSTFGHIVILPYDDEKTKWFRCAVETIAVDIAREEITLTGKTINFI